VGLRGGTFDFEVDPSFTRLTDQLHAVRFAQDVAVSGTATYGFSSELIDAPITLNGPGAEDGALHIRGVWFGFFNPTTVFRVRGTLGGRHVALRVPAS
jgi:hypothetical protein